MFQFIIIIAQILFIIWPIILIIVGFMMFYGPGGIRGFLKRIRRSLFVTWIVLLVIWILAQLGSQPIHGIIPEPQNSILFFSGLTLFSILEFFPLIRKKLSNEEKLRKIRAIEDLKRLDPGQFEEMVAVTYQALGFWVRRVGRSGDHGVDLKMRSSDGKYMIVQCKKYRDSVGEAYIRDLYGTLLHENADRAIMVTSADITKAAEKWAKGKPIELIDGINLLKLMEKARKKVQRNWINKIFDFFNKKVYPQEKSISICPACHSPMFRRPPRLIDHPRWILYRCSRYPNCRVIIDMNTPHNTNLDQRYQNL